MTGVELASTAVLFAAGVSVDAALLTICDFDANQQRGRALRWVVWVTVAHWALAAVGLSGFWTLKDAIPAIAPAIQVVTAAVLAFVIVHVLSQLWSLRTGRSRPTRCEGQLGFAAKVWLVSVDALFVGAAESAATTGWTRGHVVVATLLLGPLILLWMLAALVAARRVARLVARRALDVRTVELGAGVGQRAVLLPIFSYLLLCAVRSSQLL